MQNKTIFIGAAIGLFIVSLVGGYYGPLQYARYQESKARADFVPPAVPQKAVDAFSLDFSKLMVATEPMYLPDVPFKDTKGKNHTIADFAGRPTLVNLWATWCAPCVVELPSLNKFREHYKDRLNVIGISVGDTKTPAEIGRFLDRRQLGAFPGFVDQTGEFSTKLGIQGIPTSFLLGSQGQILYRFEGDADWTSPDSQRFFDVFLLQNK